MPLEEALGDFPRALMMWRVWELLVLPEHDYARPLPVSGEFIHLDTDKGILAHPLDFHAERGVAIQALAVEVDMNGNDIRLVVLGARQPGDMRPGEQCAALWFRHFLDSHGQASHRKMVTPPPV
jgi:hypothetical protein